MERPARRFLFRLASHLKKTVNELLDTVDSHELTEWLAYSTIEPLDGDRGDIHSAQICSLLANQWRGKGAKAATVSDFIPDWYAQPKATTFEDSVLAWAMAVGTIKKE